MMLGLLIGASCAITLSFAECDAEPDNNIKWDRTIGGKEVDPKGTTAFTTNMRGLSVDYKDGTFKPREIPTLANSVHNFRIVTAQEKQKDLMPRSSLTAPATCAHVGDIGAASWEISGGRVRGERGIFSNFIASEIIDSLRR